MFTTQFTYLERLFSRLSNPLLLGLLISFFMGNPSEFTEGDAYLIATGIALTIVVPILIFHPFMLFLFKQGMRLRIACCSLIYSKVSDAVFDFILSSSIETFHPDPVVL